MADKQNHQDCEVPYFSDDDVTPEGVETMRKKVSKVIDKQEWEIVDTPLRVNQR